MFTSFQNTPLHLASKAGFASAVTLLLSMGAEIHHNQQELHFFDYAIQQEHKDVCIAVVTNDRCVYNIV